MRILVLAALIMVPLAGCSGEAAESKQASGTPLPDTGDKAAIKRIADGLSDEGEFSDRAMFKSFMLGKEMFDKGALKTQDTDRFVAATVEEAIAKHRKLKQESAAEIEDVAGKRERGDLELVGRECEEHKKGFNGQPMVWPNGYKAKGETYADPCAALEALTK